ncbi:PREDICTED: uncharacterized membrane protein C776.05-like [Amphimedon queenslandica]|uniref:Glycerophosphocholine acyltransferase 1 n=1 Tax=Amphimedon queenslandica TaxID=400682 RepID=A0A1X7VQG8_AMPQE|nr:PREDICTED: uncharacterized membrane protein C776.05-like [Amphimedon queenslandica]|eukprot:XP_019861289.1 PREDICTED: uncharacterized membrane protein C776.05-like [Amphimedon queenslandica]
MIIVVACGHGSLTTNNMATGEDKQEKSSKDEFGALDDLLDFESIELLDEDFNDIVSIRKLSDSTADKLTFTVFLSNVMLTAFLAGYVPQYFYYWHSVKSVALILIRWLIYKRKRWHYFLFDFCYFVNLLLFVYFWSPWKPNWLFPAIFVLSHGPLLFAIPLWRNSVVPHSLDKMTSLFIHISPPLATWGVRWFSTPEQGLVLCSKPSAPGPRGCDDVGWVELIVCPLGVYLVWMLLYVFVVLVWKKKRVRERSYVTSVGWMTERVKKGFLYKLFSICGEKYLKYIYFSWQTVYTCLGISSAFVSYHWMEYGVILMSVTMVIACYNGASFYIDVIGHKYYELKMNKNND